MQSRIQGAFHARLAVFVLAGAFVFFPSVVRAGGEDPPHGRPGMGGDVALRGGVGGDGRGGRPEERRIASDETPDPLGEVGAAIDRWLRPVH